MPTPDMKFHFRTALAKVLEMAANPGSATAAQQLAEAAQKLVEAEKTYFNKTPGGRD